MRPWSILVALCLGLLASGQPAAAYEFALSLSPSSDGQLFGFFLVKVKDDQVVESRPITRESFIKQVQGRTFSQANPDAEDLFRKYGVEACTLPPDSAAMGFLTNCPTLDNLWKLRYWEYPVKEEGDRRARQGWSEKHLAPSPRQMEILGGYGLKFINGMILGQEMFRLLRDMGEREWVNNYRGN